MLDSLVGMFHTEQARVIGAIAGGALALGVVATAFALASYWKTRSWVKAEATIRSSASGFRIVQRSRTEVPRNERVANIAYEFRANGKTWQSRQILDTGDPQEDDVERLFEAYPAGKVVTILHDPRDPSRSALELNAPPPDLAKGCLAAALILVVFALAALWLTTIGIGQIEALLPGAIVPVMLLSLVAGLVFLAVAVAAWRRTAEVARWPRVAGVVKLSRVEPFRVQEDPSKRRPRRRTRVRTGYMPVVEYAYTVGGRDFTSRSIWADTEVSGDQAYARRLADRYPTGLTVTVFYDPQDPSHAALERGGHWWIMMIPAVIGLGVAAATSGLFF